MGLSLAIDKRDYSPVSAFESRAPAWVKDENAWLMFHPHYYWRVKVQFDARNGVVPRTPERNEVWRIGIVQNVLFARIVVRYFNLDPIQVAWDQAVVDALDAQNLPFYGPATPTRVVMVGSDRRSNNELKALSFQPLQIVFYGRKGIGYLLDPYPESTVPLAFSPLGSPVELTFRDAPSLYLPYRRRGQALRLAERLSAYQFWVVALSPRKEPFVLASSPAFTLASWIRFQPSPFKSLGPPPDWGSYMVTGLIRNVQYLQDSPDTKDLQPRPGLLGGRKPVLGGQIANDRGMQWLLGVGLISPSNGPD